MDYEIINGDCLKVLKDVEDNFFDAVVTDPPYGLKFMGKDWDKGVPGEVFWREILRVMKPGAHLLSFGGTRTHHRLMVAIEDAGFEIRDCLGWLYGSGFPKSLDVSKAIDKAVGVEREVVATYNTHDIRNGGLMDKKRGVVVNITAPATDAAKQWSGWGTALKPAWEPIILARKPLDGTVANNVLKHGCGGINVDGCRVEHNEDISVIRNKEKILDTKSQGWGFKSVSRGNEGRFPANIIHDGSDEVLEVFPDSKGGCYPERRGSSAYFGLGDAENRSEKVGSMGDSGSAARFFYCAKTNKKDRDEGCEDIQPQQKVFNGQSDHQAGCADGSVEDKFTTQPGHNNHPTVKPTTLMRYLCRLITPPDGLILDPFCGSGSTGKAAMLEGFNFIGIDLNKSYCAIAEARCKHAKDDASV